MSTSERKEWRRSFTETIMELAKGRVDVLEAASWALEAQHLQGYRDPKEVAGEQFKNVDTSARNVDIPVSGGISASTQMPAFNKNAEFILTRPDQNRFDAGAP